MTRSDLRQLAADGNEIGGHTVSHLRLTALSTAEARRQVCDSRSILARWGYRGGWLPLVFHHVCGGSRCGGLAVPATMLDTFARWLAQRQQLGTAVRTVGQVIGGPDRSTPPAAAAPGGLRPAGRRPPCRRAPAG